MHGLPAGPFLAVCAPAGLFLAPFDPGGLLPAIRAQSNASYLPIVPNGDIDISEI
jgi:hypothetical protein